MPNQTTPVAATRQFADFAAALTYDALPDNVREALTIFLLDYLRVASLGQRMPWSAWATNLAREQGGSQHATVLFSQDRTDPERATFVNSTYAGSIDADDVHVGSMLHPGCIVISAALAIGEARGLSGERILTAIAAGYENMIRIGLAIQPSHFKRGFQSTATCGGFGAATAAATGAVTMPLFGLLARNSLYIRIANFLLGKALKALKALTYSHCSIRVKL